MYQKKTKCKIYVFVTTFFGGCNVLSTQWQSLGHDFFGSKELHESPKGS